jgi:propanol-preferring alcohol dehydrogenase
VKAIQLEQGEVHVRDVDTPEPGPDQARVHLSAAGVCHSDLHLARGDWAGLPRDMPLGHEGIGVVEALGPGAERYVSVGDRVILGLGGAGGGYWCGACEYCLSGKPRLCAQAGTVMGTFAEHMAIWAPALVKLPDEVGDEEAPLACGGLTAFSSLRKLVKHGVYPGRTIAIIGAAGGLGHYAVQIANAFGYRVIGVDVGEERLEFVRSLGAEHAVSSDEAAMFALGLGGVDAVLVYAARIEGFELGLQMLKRGGLFVGVGIPPSGAGNLQVNPWMMFLTDPTIIFSAVGTVQEMRELVELAARGKVKTHVSRVGSLSDVSEIFEELEAGKYTGRAVINDLTR